MILESFEIKPWICSSMFTFLSALLRPAQYRVKKHFGSDNNITYLRWRNNKMT